MKTLQKKEKVLLSSIFPVLAISFTLFKRNLVVFAT